MAVARFGQRRSGDSSHYSVATSLISSRRRGGSWSRWVAIIVAPANAATLGVMSACAQVGKHVRVPDLLVRKDFTAVVELIVSALEEPR